MSLTFYPTISRGELGKYSRHLTRVLLTASSWAAEEVKRYGRVRRSLPIPYLPDVCIDRAADCGGFVATFKWKDYRYTAAQYVEWLDSWRPTWAATMDYCCEDQVTSGNPFVVEERQEKTTAMAYHFWTTYREKPWVWAPTIQGWQVHEYVRHAQTMRPLIQEMYAHYGKHSAFRVGIGTLCARASAEMIHEVVRSIIRELPGIPLHLWGIKLGTFSMPYALPEQVVSCDSAAWNGMWGRGREIWKSSGYSQREWCLKVALPLYEEKLYAALRVPKQARMF